MRALAFKHVSSHRRDSRAWPPRTRSCLLAFLTLIPLWACGGDSASGPLDPDTFGGMHQSELADDCKQTVQCKLQNGETVYKDDPVGKCIIDTANMLNDDKDRQKKFLANYPRCSVFKVCDYITCVSTGGATYGDLQREDIRHACQAEVECNVVNNAMGDTPLVCEEKKVNQLNTYVPSQRERWEASFKACEDKAGCAYVDCYNSAFFGATGM